MSEFDPSRYLTKVSGADYLEVKWRLLWLRMIHPNAIIDTTLISHSDQVALFKATIEIPTSADGTGGGMATGHGSEAYGDFRDYLEKAETKAIGRALAALGFGTQFCNDFAFGADQNRIVDAPVALQRQMERRQVNDAPPRNRSTSRNTLPDAPQSLRSDETSVQASEHPTMDQRALTAIFALTKNRGVSNDELHAIARHRYGVDSLKALRVDHGRDLYLMLQKETDEGIKHELRLANGSPEPHQQADMLPDVAGKARA